MEVQYKEYGNTDKHNNTVKDKRDCRYYMHSEEEKTKKNIEIAYSSTNECQFIECLEKIIKDHCK